MKKTYKKVFDFKGQAINYYNKVCQNDKIQSVNFCFMVKSGKWELTYCYK